MKKLIFRKRFCCSMAALSLFVVCGNNLFAAYDSSVGNTSAVNNSQQSVKEKAPDFILTSIYDESVSPLGTSITDEIIPYELWNVTQVIFEKSTNAKTVKNIYNNASEVQSIIPCPLKWEIINSKELVMYFSDDKKETLEYTLKNGQLIINYIGAKFQYLYNINNETITLTATVKNGNTEESLIITSKKQN